MGLFQRSQQSAPAPAPASRKIVNRVNMAMKGIAQNSVMHYGYQAAFVMFYITITAVTGCLGLTIWTSQQFFYAGITYANPNDPGIFGHLVAPLSSVVFAFVVFIGIQWGMYFRPSGHYATIEKQHTNVLTHGESAHTYEDASVTARVSDFLADAVLYIIALDLLTSVGGWLKWFWPGIVSLHHGIAYDRLAVGSLVSIALSLASFFIGECGFLICWHFWDYAHADRARHTRIVNQRTHDNPAPQPNNSRAPVQGSAANANRNATSAMATQQTQTILPANAAAQPGLFGTGTYSMRAAGKMGAPAVDDQMEDLQTLRLP